MGNGAVAHPVSTIAASREINSFMVSDKLVDRDSGTRRAATPFESTMAS